MADSWTWSVKAVLDHAWVDDSSIQCIVHVNLGTALLRSTINFFIVVLMLESWSSHSIFTGLAVSACYPNGLANVSQARAAGTSPVCQVITGPTFLPPARVYDYSELRY